MKTKLALTICCTCIFLVGCNPPNRPYYVNVVNPDNEVWRWYCTLQHKILNTTDNSEYELTAELREIKHADIKQARLVAILPAGIKHKEMLASLPREMVLSGKVMDDGTDVTYISWTASKKEWGKGRFDIEVTTISKNPALAFCLARPSFKRPRLFYSQA